ncbi:MAG: hypothetical protein COU71_00985 [Parcubacteria group bacterium CG10_big_fil_rev_8_21_14_0_10_38_31]|nr:MAG: hypothetical protein COU71_00985 [Parcubacteria group bacterium CG10_big_fil_rev_8_21_14_0_10_38_31]
MGCKMENRPLEKILEEILEMMCKCGGCGWEGRFEKVIKVDEVCCPTIMSFICPECKGEIVSINTAGPHPLRVEIKIDSGESLFIIESDYPTQIRAIPHIDSKYRPKVAVVKIALSYIVIKREINR